MNQATNIGTVEAALRRSEREKDLEKQVTRLLISCASLFILAVSRSQLIKAKRDKDKSLKLLIQIIGKVSSS
jgi:hypothetical protein